MVAASDRHFGYTVELCDRDWQPVSLLRNWTDLTYVERFLEVGAGKVNALSTEENRANTQPGATVLVKQFGQVVQAGLLEPHDSGAFGTGTLALDWKDTTVYLSDRYAFQAPNRTTAEQGAYEFDTHSGYTSTVISNFVSVNAGAAARDDRRVRGLVVGEDRLLGPQITSQARMVNLLSHIRGLAVAGGVGFRVRFDDRNHVFEVFSAQDLSDVIVFAASSHSVVSYSNGWNPPTSTVVIAGGKGEGTARVFVEVTSNEAINQAARWGRRIEAFKDSSGAEVDPLIADARTQLYQSGETLEATFKVSQHAPGGMAAVGDLVTLVLRSGETVIRPVREKTTKVDSSGVAVETVAGDFSASSSSGVTFTTDGWIRAVQQYRATR
jgi:hypothetical protein